MPVRRLPAALLAALLLASLAPAAAAVEPPSATVEGTLEHELDDYFDASGRATRPPTSAYYVRDERGDRTRVTFAGEPPAEVHPGARIRVKGHRTTTGALAADGQVEVLADADAVAGGETTTTTTGALSTAATVTTPITKRLAVILVNFASNPVQPYTPEYAAGIFFTNTNSVANFFVEDSYGKLALTGDVSGWYTISYDTSRCDTAAIQTKADAAATAAGVVLADYQHVTYVFPHLPACSFAGRALIPGRLSWINTIANTTPKLHEWVISHELAHNFGAHHANTYACTTGGVRASLSATASECRATEYGDPHSVMGAWNPPARFPHVDSWHRLQLGFLPTSERKTVTGSGLFTLGATTHAASTLKSLRINRTGSSATRHWFDIEFRQPGGLWDGFASTAPVVNGVTIRLVADDSARVQSWLVDTTPATTSYVDAPLVVGQTLRDPLSKIEITTVDIVTDANGNPAARVKVLFPNTPLPTVPTDFTAASSIDGETATLTWGASTTAVGVRYYRIYRDEVLVAQVDRALRTYTDTGRTPGATYAYRIEAVDWVDLVGPSATTSQLMFTPTLGTTTASFTGAAGRAADASTETWTRAITIDFDLRFSAPVTRLTTDSLTLSGTATGCTVTGLVGAGTDYTVTVTGCSEGSVTASIAAGKVRDNLGFLAPAADATSATVLIDRTAPVSTKPAASLGEGARLSGVAVPLRIALGAADAGSGVASIDLARSLDGGAWTTVLAGTTAAFLDTTLVPGHTYRFRVRSRDAAGNVSPWVEGPLLRHGLAQQTSTGITYRGTWGSAAASEYSGASARYAVSATSSVSYTFTGRGIALVTTQAPTRGKVQVYIDGVYVRTIDLYRSTYRFRVLMFSQTFSSWGTHTIKLVPEGTVGRARVDVDAFAVIR